MKILFLTDGLYPFQIGGMQKHSTVLIKLLMQQGMDVHVLHCGGEGYSPMAFNALWDPEAKGKITETCIPFPKTDPFPGHYVRENKMYSKNAFFELENRIEEFDLIYAQGFTGWRFIKEKHKRQFKLPILVNFHGFEMFQTAPSLKVKAAYTLFKNGVKWNIRNADYVYSFGGQISDIIRNLGVDENKILLQSNGIETHWLAASPAPHNAVRKFVFVGRAERRKGIEELNEALKMVLAEKHAFEFHFVGPIPEDKRIEDNRLNYHGEIRSGERIKEILSGADCLVCPSHSEGMPTVILEAMATGLAIVGTNVGAVERQIDGNGILLENPEIEALKLALVDMINSDEEALTAYKKQSIKLIEDTFLWERVVAQKIADFKEVTKSKTPA